VLVGERRAEPVGAAVGVAVQLAGGALERLERGWNRPVGPLVRGELDDPLQAELALDLLDRLARFVGDDSADRRREEAVGDLRERHEMRAYWTAQAIRTASRSRPFRW
jgi:hypothetical protein